MKNHLIFALLTGLSLAAFARAEEVSCPEGTVASQAHTVAYCNGHACQAQMEQARCIDKELAETPQAKEYSCGPKICKDTFFGWQGVCCVTKLPGKFMTEYSCRKNIYSCPGNEERLQIRSSRNISPTEG